MRDPYFGCAKASTDGVEVSLDAFILLRPHILRGGAVMVRGCRVGGPLRVVLPDLEQCTLEVNAEGLWLGLARQSLSFSFGPGEAGGH